jgi:chemotaxis protein MotB
MNVLKLLVEDANFPPSKISAAGYGPFRPVASNETPEGRQQNRRVDLVVLAPRSSPVPIP